MKAHIQDSLERRTLCGREYDFEELAIADAETPDSKICQRCRLVRRTRVEYWAARPDGKRVARLGRWTRRKLDPTEGVELQARQLAEHHWSQVPIRYRLTGEPEKVATDFTGWAVEAAPDREVPAEARVILDRPQLQQWKPFELTDEDIELAAAGFVGDSTGTSRELEAKSRKPLTKLLAWCVSLLKG